MLSKLRPIIKPFVESVARILANFGLSPNFFSFLAIPLAVISAYFIVHQIFLFAFLFGLVAVSIDLFDGTLARLQGKVSLFGNYFETMVDKVVEVVLFVACAFLYPVAAVLALGFSMLVSYAKPRVALVILTDNRDWPGVGEHSERMLLLVLGILFSYFGLTFLTFSALEFSLWLIAVLSFIGFVQRMFFAKSLIEEAEKKGNILPYLKKQKK
ncbi:MAG: CDP-alcohol phosphatidyltransferase family protein [Candidatus Diapherotrites archaeon]